MVVVSKTYRAHTAVFGSFLGSLGPWPLLCVIVSFPRLLPPGTRGAQCTLGSPPPLAWPTAPPGSRELPGNGSCHGSPHGQLAQTKLYTLNLPRKNPSNKFV